MQRLRSNTFNRAQELLKERAPVRIRPRRVASRYLLSGLVKYGHCGKALIGQEAKSGRFSYYVCGTLNKKGAGSCCSRYLNSDKFEAAVIANIKERILTEANLEELVRLVNREADKASVDYSDELKLISREEDDIANRLGKLYDAVETGDFSLDDLSPRIKELRRRQVRLETRRVELENILSDRRVELADLETVRARVADSRDVLTDSPLCKRKALIRSFVRELIVTDNEVKLNYTLPMPPQGLTEEKAGVLGFKQSGGPFWTRTRDPSLIRTVL